MHNLSCETEFYLHVNENSFSYETLRTETRFEKQAQDNSEMAYYIGWKMIFDVTNEKTGVARSHSHFSTQSDSIDLFITDIGKWNTVKCQNYVVRLNRAVFPSWVL